MCMFCAYNTALEASISDLRREEITEELTDHRGSCKIFARVKYFVDFGHWRFWVYKMGRKFLLHCYRSPIQAEFQFGSKFRMNGTPIAIFLMISWWQDHSIVMEFLYKQCCFVKDINNDDEDCKNSV